MSPILRHAMQHVTLRVTSCHVSRQGTSCHVMLRHSTRSRVRARHVTAGHRVKLSNNALRYQISQRDPSSLVASRCVNSRVTSRCVMSLHVDYYSCCIPSRSRASLHVKSRGVLSPVLVTSRQTHHAMSIR